MRGIAILLVIFGHAQRGIFQAAQPEGLYWSHIYPALDYFIYVFHVPVFFATSGILLERQARNSFRDFRSRETRIIGLYLLWNFINAVPAFVFSDLTKLRKIGMDSCFQSAADQRDYVVLRGAWRWIPSPLSHYQFQINTLASNHSGDFAFGIRP